MSSETVSSPSIDPALARRPELPAVLADDAREKISDVWAVCRDVVKAQRSRSETLHLLGLVASRRGDHHEALVLIDKAIAADPGYEEAHRSRLALLSRFGHLAEALACSERLLEIAPGNAATHAARATLLAAQRPEAALACLDRAIALAPDVAEYRVRMGATLAALGRNDEALTCCDNALVRDPDNVAAHVHRGSLLLALGRFREGWAEYDWRWKLPNALLEAVVRDEPKWRGEPLSDKTIYLYPESDPAEAVLFARYVPLLAVLARRVVMACPEPLMALFRGLGDAIERIPLGRPPDPFDVHAGLGDLPRILGTVVETIPSRVPYFRPDPARLAHWRGRIGGRDGYRVGLAWAHDAVSRGPAGRSPDPALLAPLGRIPGVVLYGLQAPSGDEAGAIFDGQVDDLSAGLTDLAEAAAAISQLDLVVTVDNALAHVAGALGVPVWTMVATDARWCWLQKRDDSPWYPTMRLFRQRHRDDWQHVIDNLATDVGFVAGCRQGNPEASPGRALRFGR